MKKLSIIFFVLAVNFFAVIAQTANNSPDVEEKIKQVENNLAGWVQTGFDDRWNILDRMKKYKVNGVSIAVIHNFKIEWAKGYGLADVSENRPVTEKTLFQAASISKSLNSLGVLKLVEQKKIDCDSDLNKYLKSWRFPYDSRSGNGKVTVRELLSHTAGLSVHGFPGYERGKDIPTVIQVLNGEKPANTMAIKSIEAPGKHVIYSGGGTTILQLLVSDITGLPYEVYMQKEVLDPLGMTSSCYCQPPAVSPDLLATAYKANGKEVPGKYHVYPEMAAAGLWTNPTDLCKYVIETELAWRGESHKVLSPEMTRMRLTPVMDDAALGVFVNSRVTGSYKYFNHNGGNEGFLSTYYGCRDSGEGVAIMINSENWTIIDEILNSVASVYGWKDFYLPEIKKPVDVPENLVMKYIGKFQLGMTRVEIIPDKYGLGIKSGEGEPWAIYFTSDSDFFVKESRGMCRFQFSPDGKVKGFTTGSITARKIVLPEQITPDFTGTWDLDHSKSDAEFKDYKITCTITQSATAITVKQDIVMNDGKVSSMPAISYNIDNSASKDNKKDNNDISSVLSVDKKTLTTKYVKSMNGNEYGTITTYVLSDDGKTLTIKSSDLKGESPMTQGYARK